MPATHAAHVGERKDDFHLQRDRRTGRMHERDGAIARGCGRHRHRSVRHLACVVEQTGSSLEIKICDGFVPCGEQQGDLILLAPGYRVVPERSECAGHQVRCPRCNGRAERIRRRLFDRIVSLFTPVRRYRCWSHDFKWEANLRHLVTHQAMAQHRHTK